MPGGAPIGPDDTPGAAARTLHFGRYAVLELLGVEGNGVVYAAYDAQLDRRVLLKLLDASFGAAPGQRARLLRDATAMASLSHPNVIEVLEAGELHGQVFLATALLDDPSLAEWLKASRRPWPEVLRVFIQAGRGLAAIEAAGVRAPFDPEHVAISGRGGAHRVRITEFGNFANEFTKSARAEQQTFAAAIERAFAGDARVPGRVRRILQRGRALRPERRFSSLAKLLEALEADPRRGWHRAGALAAAAVAIAALILGVRWQTSRRARACAGMGGQLAGVWDLGVRARARVAFGASSLPFADESWTLAEEALGRYAASWTELRTEACEAAAARHPEPAALLEQRIECLGDRRASLRATASLLASADAKTITRAAGLVAALPRLRECDSEAALRFPAAPSADLRLAVDEAFAKLAGLRARVAAGQAPLEDAKALVFAAERLGHPRLRVAAQQLLGEIEEAGEDFTGARQSFLRATALALETKSDRALLDGWLALVDLDLRLARTDQALDAAEQARAAASRIPGDARAQGALLISLAWVSLARDRLDAAQAQLERAAALLAQDPDDRELEIEALSLQSQTFAQRGQWQPAISASQRGLALAQAMYGPDHPQPGQLEQELGTLLAQAGRLGDARPHLERALASAEGLFDPGTPAVADALVALAQALASAEPERALGLLRRALAIEQQSAKESVASASTHEAIAAAEAALGDDGAAQAELQLALAMQRRVARGPGDLTAAAFAVELAEVDTRAGRYAEARKLLEAALATEEKKRGAEADQTGDAVEALARLEVAQHHLAPAKKLCERALAIAQDRRGPGSAEALDRELLLSEIELGRGEPDAARPRLERLIQLFATPGGDQSRLARARGLLAQALWKDPAARPRARKLLAQAQASAQGEVTPADRDVLQRWIARH